MLTNKVGQFRFCESLCHRFKSNRNEGEKNVSNKNSNYVNNVICVLVRGFPCHTASFTANEYGLSDQIKRVRQESHTHKHKHQAMTSSRFSSICIITLSWKKYNKTHQQYYQRSLSLFSIFMNEEKNQANLYEWEYFFVIQKKCPHLHP